MILFFDLDGTIWNYRNEIPESTVEGIHKAQKNGHLAFINTGRSRAFIRHPDLLSIGFDGIVSACGTMIEYRDEVVFQRLISRELAEHTVRTVRSFGFRPILEGTKYLYFDDDEFSGDKYSEKIRSELGDDVRGINDNWGAWEILKLSCATENADFDGCFAALGSEYDFLVHNAAVCEMVPKGFHKGTGILKVCDILGADVSETMAFGDSVNDCGMLTTAGTAVVMGNGTDAAKECADYITSDLEDDGIYRALEHFELI